MLVNAVFDKEPSSAPKGLLHAFETVFVMRKNPGRKAASGALKNPFREKSSADGRIIKKWCEQRGKSGFWLPDSSKTGRAAPKVGKKREKHLIFVYRTLQIWGMRPRKQTKNGGNVSFLSTGLSKFGPRGSESRTKSPKIGKMFYSVTFAKAVRSQITGKSTANQKSLFCSQHNSGAVIEQMMRSTVFGKITAVYGHIDENGRFVRKWTVPKMAITDKMVKNGRLSVKIQVFRTRFYGQNLQKAGFVRKSSS